MIYILPGMGADSSMYSGPWLDNPDFTFLDWPKFQGEKTISEVADRIISLHKITDADSVAGSSLGGMVALEIACKLGIKNVYLFGSAINRYEIKPWLRFLSPLAQVAPWKFLQKIAGKSEGRILTMFSRAEAGFIRSMCRAIVNWPGYHGDLGIVKRIHGRKDLLISCHTRCVLIKDGGHLIAISHPHECLGIIK